MLPESISEYPLNHLAIAVDSLATAGPTYTALGFALEDPIILEREKIRAQVVTKGNLRIELLEPCPAGAGPIGMFLSKRGPGMHHIALTVERLEDTIEELKANGIKSLPGYPAEGLHHSQVAFLDPKTTGGVLIELVCLGSIDYGK